VPEERCGISPDCLSVTLQHKLRGHAPGLTPRPLLEKLAATQMLDVSFPTTDGRLLVMPRYTEPDPEQAIVLHQLGLALQRGLLVSGPQPSTLSPNSKCSGNLWDDPVENKVSSSFRCPQLRKSG
jgi:hypothetical protein